MEPSAAEHRYRVHYANGSTYTSVFKYTREQVERMTRRGREDDGVQDHEGIVAVEEMP